MSRCSSLDFLSLSRTFSAALGAVCATLFIAIPPAHANVCGTDYQSFNPTTSGLDFVTVHSSETLKPCHINFGTFAHYSRNTLTYTRSFTDANGRTYRSGQKPNDHLWGLDLSFGTGLTDRWDVGINVPFVLGQSVDDPALSSSYKSEGATEIKANTKYRLAGDELGGVAIIGSANQNLIRNNPFTGRAPGPTLNLEVAFDRSFEKWATAVNFGHRWRNPGERISNVPFEPLGNQIIYSAATSYYFEDLETKVIFELFGGRFLKESNQNSTRSPDSFEWLAGIKHDLNNNAALHFGGGTQLFSALGSPEVRIYAGINWAIGPFCDETPQAVAPETPPPRTQIVRYSASVLFDFDSSQLRSDELPSVDQYFDQVDLARLERITIEGHTDSLGPSTYNQVLSERRALSLKAYLLKRYPALSQQMVDTVGYGEDRPIADNANYQGRQKNRRVEFVVVRKE